jgi:hypothetical protein
LITVPEASPYIEAGALQRLIPKWYADLGPISIYYASRTLMPAKTRAFVDFVVETFRRDRVGRNSPEASASLSMNWRACVFPATTALRRRSYVSAT